MKSRLARALVGALAVAMVPGCDYNRDREKIRSRLIAWNLLDDSPLTLEPPSALVRLDEGLAVKSFRRLLSGGLSEVTAETEWAWEDRSGRRVPFEEAGFFRPRGPGFYWLHAKRDRKTAKIPVEAVSASVRRMECVQLRPADQAGAPSLEFHGSFAFDAPWLFSLTDQRTAIEINNPTGCEVGLALKSITPYGEALASSEVTVRERHASVEIQHRLLSRLLVTVQTSPTCRTFATKKPHRLGDAANPILVRGCDTN